MKDLFEFNLTDENTRVLPKEIVEFQCDELLKRTKGYVIGKIIEYDNPIEDYTTGFGKTLSVVSALSDMYREKNVKIQSELGEVSGNKFTYEFFITSKNTVNYKYRVFFLRYGISCYPLQVVLDENIASEIGVDTDFTCNSEESFYEVLGKILNSSKIVDVVTNLYAINVKEEKRKMDF